jgi:uncharacterized heparinase superfamily protein
MHLENQFLIVLMTARRAGVRRSLARVRRILFLRWLNPRFASRLYQSRIVHPPTVETATDLIPLAFRSASPMWNDPVVLLNSEPFSMRPPIDWNANPRRHTLWAFRLHEFGWAWSLIQLASQGDADAGSKLAAIMQDYMERVPFACGVAGEPYTLSRRLVVWSVAWHVLANAFSARPSWLDQFASQIDQSARMLANIIEHDLDNNHVIANAKALAFAGTLIGQAEYARPGFDLFWKQLRFQVRDDGMHFENSTSYHWLVLCDAVDMIQLAYRFSILVPDDIALRVRKMADVVRALRRPDGTLPLLNDSVDEYFENVDAVLDAAGSNEEKTRTTKSICFPQAGYAILRVARTLVLFDAGNLGPFFCPGHGHADALSFELWARNRLLIADPGTYQYQAGEWRDYFRSTAAHSTVVVDGQNQSELSDSFRVGRMAAATFTRVELDHELVEGKHTGYRRLSQPVTHTRTVTLANENELRIMDCLAGTGEHDVDVCFHLTSGAQVEIGEQSAQVSFGNSVRLRFQFKGASAFTVTTSGGWCSSLWYAKSPSLILHYRGRCVMPLTIDTIMTIAD